MTSWADLSSNLGPITNLPCAPSTMKQQNVQPHKGTLINETLRVIAQCYVPSVPSLKLSGQSLPLELTPACSQKAVEWWRLGSSSCLSI